MALREFVLKSLLLIGGILCLLMMGRAQSDDIYKRLPLALKSLKTAQSAPAAKRDSLIQEALRQLRPLPKEQRVPITAPLAQASANNDTEEQDALLAVAIGRIEGYLSLWDEASPDAQSGYMVQQRLKAIYDSPEMKPPPPSVLERFLRWFGERVEEFFKALGKLFGMPALGAGIAGSSVLQYVMIGIVVLALALGGTYLLNKAQWRRGQKNVSSIESEMLKDARALTPEEWRARARSKAGQGDYREASRYLFQAALHTLNANGYLKYDPARTNWEHAHQLAANHHRELYDLIRPMTIRFDLIWYGGHEANQLDWREMDDAVEQLIRFGGERAKTVA